MIELDPNSAEAKLSRVQALAAEWVDGSQIQRTFGLRLQGALATRTPEPTGSQKCSFAGGKCVG